MPLRLSKQDIIDEISQHHVNDEYFILDLINTGSTCFFQEKEIFRLLLKRLINIDGEFLTLKELIEMYEKEKI